MTDVFTALSAETAAEIAEKIAEDKKTAPTRPHPHTSPSPVRWLCWTTNTMTRVRAAATVWKTTSHRADNPCRG